MDLVAHYPGRIASAAPRLLLDFAAERGGTVVAARVADGARAAGADLSALQRDLWVPFATHLAVLEQVEAALGADALWDAGLHGARNAHRFVPGLAALLHLARPRRLLTAAPLVWRTYADFGDVRAESARAGGRLALSSYRAHPSFCGTLGGFLAGLLTRVGAHACAVEHTECMLRGAPACVFTGTWT